MDSKRYYHLCADGFQARNFILCRQDFVAAMNIIALCSANTDATVVAFSIEDTHPHVLLYGTLEACVRFAELFETVYRHYAASTREGGADFCLNIDIYQADTDEQHLMKVAVYVIIQPTKDGKPVMPFDYLWGSGSLYFRRPGNIPVWLMGGQGSVRDTVRFGSLPEKEKARTIHSRKYSIPDEWLLAGGIVLPSNYVDVARYESIFRTHNCYRVFLSGSKAMEKEVLLRIAQARGVSLEDTEARRLCGDKCALLYGIRDPRRLNPLERISLAQVLRKEYRLSFRQLSQLLRLPEYEIRRYVP